MRAYAHTIREFELARWLRPELKGKLCTLDQLEKMVGGVVKRGELYAARAVSGRFRNVAYVCTCGIVIGPPDIRVQENAGLFAGREALDFYCTNCYVKMR
ncbi:hypothetical protein J4211_04285 [Candidatus Woesearchaeota archaeon]|nr:hypothetical protein [Candidatus Woesearchaeota archaeon]